MVFSLHPLAFVNLCQTLMWSSLLSINNIEVPRFKTTNEINCCCFFFFNSRNEYREEELLFLISLFKSVSILPLCKENIWVFFEVVLWFFWILWDIPPYIFFVINILNKRKNIYIKNKVILILFIITLSISYHQ